MNWPAFTNPWMLAGLAAVGLPVLIHYLTRARPRRIAFPPFRFLVEACAGQQAVHRLRTIVLLTLRGLIVLALVLLFARPFLKPAGTAVEAQAAKRIVLILDASLSMRAVHQGVTLFARAQSEAADVLRALESGAEAAVVLEGAAPRPLLPALSRNFPALHEELVKTQPTFEEGNPAAALALARKMLGGTGTIYVFSDFQKSNWQGVRDLPSGVICRLRPVTSEAVDNVAIMGARLVPAEPVAGEPVEVVCTIFNCTPHPREENVRLELGESTHETRLALAPFANGEAAFTVTFPRPGSYTGKASIQADDLPEDNTRYLAVRVSKALRILLISDADAADPHSAAFYIGRALVPTPQAAPGLELIRRDSQDTDRGILETADVFILAAPAMPSGEAMDILSSRVNAGAGMMGFLDGPTSPLLVPTAFSPPFQLQRSVVSGGGDPIIPGLRPLFADADAADFSAARFFRHYQNQVLQNRSSEVLFAYPDGSAALTLSPVGAGEAAFVNLPLTPDGGNFIGSPMFPVLLHEMLRALRRGAGEHPVTPGMDWVLDVPSHGEGPLTVTGPDGRALDARVLASGRTTRLALRGVSLPGVYIVKQANEVVAHSVVNAAPAESDTRPIALENLKAGEGSVVTVVQDEDELAIAGKNRPLWPQLAAATAAGLALEMLLLALWRRPAAPLRDRRAPRSPAVAEDRDLKLRASPGEKVEGPG